MDPDGLWKIVLLLVCLILSATFSAAETALMTLSKIRIKQMAEDKVKGAERVERLIEDPSKLLSAILIGNNAVNIGASAISTSLAIDLFGSKGVGIATGVMTFLVLVFGEITPKSMAAQKSEKIALRLSRFVSFMTIILSPLISIFTLFTNFLIKLLGGKVDAKQPFITHEELRTLVNVSHEEGVLEGEEKEMIDNVFDFRDSQVRDVMIPRTEMVAIDIELAYEDIIHIFKQEQYSRIPVYEDTIDNIVGILHVKDLLFLESKKDFQLRKYLREPYFTYEFKSTIELFEEMRSKRVHFAIVLDEYGGTDGIVTIEDLIEEIVGDIEDEYDKDIAEIKVINEDEYVVYGNVKIEDINELIGTNIESEDFDSIGGFIIGSLGRFPETGENIEYESVKFVVESINKNKIEQIRILT